MTPISNDHSFVTKQQHLNDMNTTRNTLRGQDKRIDVLSDQTIEAYETALEAREAVQAVLVAVTNISSSIKNDFLANRELLNPLLQGVEQASRMAQESLRITSQVQNDSSLIEQALQTAARALEIVQKVSEEANEIRRELNEYKESQQAAPEPEPVYEPQEDLEIVDSIDGNALTPRQTVYFTSGRSVNVWNHNFPFGSSVGNWVPGNTVSVEQRDDGNGIDPYKLQNLNIDPAGKKKVNGGGCRTQ
ncbi:MAG: hypothetical protein JSS32_10225 [Verrucomicrobia bacterium]|nr:hypothetical protein [Verrucomicrobiota bacterium]